MNAKLTTIKIARDILSRMDNPTEADALRVFKQVNECCIRLLNELKAGKTDWAKETKAQIYSDVYATLNKAN